MRIELTKIEKLIEEARDFINAYLAMHPSTVSESNQTYIYRSDECANLQATVGCFSSTPGQSLWHMQVKPSTITLSALDEHIQVLKFSAQRFEIQAALEKLLEARRILKTLKVELVSDNKQNIPPVANPAVSEFPSFSVLPRKRILVALQNTPVADAKAKPTTKSTYCVKIFTSNPVSHVLNRTIVKPIAKASASIPAKNFR